MKLDKRTINHPLFSEANDYDIIGGIFPFLQHHRVITHQCLVIWVVFDYLRNALKSSLLQSAYLRYIAVHKW